MKEIDYPYIKEDVLNNKISYSYADYKGEDFIISWKTLRESFINKIQFPENFNYTDIANLSIPAISDESSSDIIFNSWIKSLNKNEINFDKINLLLKRFEVTKRIYGSYDINFRPIDKLDYQNLYIYIKFGYILVQAYQSTKKLQYINSLLKLDDIICSLFDELSENEKPFFSWILQKEIEFIELIMKDRLKIQIPQR